MDSWSQYNDRARIWWNELSPRNRIYSIGTAVLFLVVIGITLSMHSDPRLVPLSLGKELSSEELERIETSLRSHNLTDYQRTGNQILVPEDRQTAYDSALVETRSLPGDWASDWEQKFEATNAFTSSRKLRMLKDIALAKELKRIIQGLDGIQEASVVWTESDQQGWSGRKTGVTATVNIRSEPDRILAERTIRGIQFSVANMVADLEPESVLVFDAATGQHYQMQPEEARFESAFDQWLEVERRNWFSRLESALHADWPEAQLLLSIDELGLRESLRQSVSTKSFESTANGSLHIHSKQLAAPEHLNFSRLKPRLQAAFPHMLSLTVRTPTKLVAQQPEMAETLRSIADSSVVRFEELESSGSLAPLDSSSDIPFANLGSMMLSIILGTILCVVVWTVAARRPPKQNVSQEQSIPTSDGPFTEKPERPTTMNSPLGDPETVASVLQNWLKSSSSEEPTEEPHRG